MEFFVLGTLRVQVDGRALDLGWPKQRAVLAALLLTPNRPVAVSDLIAAAWAEDPPESAVGGVQKYISGLRHALGADRLVTRRPGYLVTVRTDELDLLRFDALAGQGREALEAGDARRAVECWRRALALWHGELVEDVELGDAWAPVRSALRERRMALRTALIDARLALGEHEPLIPELRELVAAEPTAERHWAQLMRALRAAGRGAEGLTVYARACSVLADQLGADPGAELREQHALLLAEQQDQQAQQGQQDPRDRQVRSDSWVVQRQLPLDARDFVGRTRVSRELLRLLRPDGGDGLPVLAISGSPGVGKTALALRVAHRSAEYYPDGQWFVRLNGAGPAPRDPASVLAELLHASGLQSWAVPDGADARAAALRARLAGRRVLLVLDDAASAGQVRALLPGTPGCAALITSRPELRGLVALDGARLFGLDTLDAAESRALIASLIGDERAAAEPAATAEMAMLCAHLPLALRVAAANLASRPEPSISRFVTELRHGNRLAALAVHGDQQAAVLAAFETSYRALAPELRRFFRVLGLVPGPDITVPAAAALAGVDARSSASLLGGLAVANLVQERAPGRFGLHDLLRLYAVERAAAEDGAAACQAALTRLLDWYLAMTDTAADLLYPQMARLPRAERAPGAFADDLAAAGWLDAERPNLLAAVRHAADSGPHAHAWHLADALRGYFWFRLYGPAWADAARAGLRAAVRRGDRLGEATMRASLGHLCWSLGDYPAATEHYERALDLLTRYCPDADRSSVLGHLNLVYHEQGRLTEATNHRHMLRLLAVSRRDGEQRVLAVRLNNVANALYNQGRFAEALQTVDQAIAGAQRDGSRVTVGLTWHTRGETLACMGRPDQAVECFERSLAIFREFGHRNAQTGVLDGLAAAHRDLGHGDVALHFARQAHRCARETGNRRDEACVLATTSTVLQRLGQLEEAVEQYTAGLRLAAETGFQAARVRALLAQAGCERQLGRPDDALAREHEALELVRATGQRPLEAAALVGMARSCLQLDRCAPARRHAERALRIHDEIGSWLGKAHALYVLGDVEVACGRIGHARNRWSEALALFRAISTPEAAVLRDRLAPAEARPRDKAPTARSTRRQIVRQADGSVR